MGGRGSSSGMSKKGKKYGTEYHSLLQINNVKFIKKNDGSTTAPMETMTPNRVYVTVNKKDEPKNITFYDKGNKRYKQIDLIGYPHKIDGVPTLPHTHLGYFHSENGTRKVNNEEAAFIEKIKSAWDNKRKT